MVMTNATINEQIQEIILELLPDITGEDLQQEIDIFSLGLDSINAMTLVTNLQDTFEIELDVNEISFENFQSISSIANLVKEKKG